MLGGSNEILDGIRLLILALKNHKRGLLVGENIPFQALKAVSVQK